MMRQHPHALPLCTACLLLACPTHPFLHDVLRHLLLCHSVCSTCRRRELLRFEFSIAILRIALALFAKRCTATRTRVVGGDTASDTGTTDAKNTSVASSTSGADATSAAASVVAGAATVEIDSLDAARVAQLKRVLEEVLVSLIASLRMVDHLLTVCHHWRSVRNQPASLCTDD